MKLTVGMADTIVSINLLGKARQAAPLCQEYFKDFLCPEQKEGAAIRVRVLKNLQNRLPAENRAQTPVFEKRLPIREATARLNKAPRFSDDFSITPATIAASFLHGLLLFNPDTSEGRIYLLKEGTGCFQPIFRLLWMYFAQVLGERKACFLHSAALARGEKGYLFLGDSGAGKSSLARICGKSTLFSDDSPVLCTRNGEYLVFPSPYHQIDHFPGLDKKVIGRSARVEGFFFLLKDKQPYLESMPPKEAVALIINRHILFFQYLSARARLLLFDLFLDACHKIPSYNFHFCLDKDIWKTIDA